MYAAKTKGTVQVPEEARGDAQQLRQLVQDSELGARLQLSQRAPKRVVVARDGRLINFVF